MQYKLSQKINSVIFINFIIISVLFSMFFFPLQKYRQENSIKKSKEILNILFSREKEPLANEMFEKRYRAVTIRINDIINVEGVLSITVYDNQLNPIDHIDRLNRNPEILSSDKDLLKDEPVIYTRRWNNYPVLIYESPITAMNQTIGYIKIVYSIANNEYERRLLYFGYFTLLGIILFAMLLVLNYLLNVTVIHPISSLQKAMKKIQEEGPGTIIPVKSKDELGDLTDSFNKMSGELKDTLERVNKEIKERLEAERALKDNEENLRITLNSIGDAVIATDTNGVVKQINPIACKLIGWDPEEAKGKHLREIFRVINPGTKEEISDPVKIIINENKVINLPNPSLLLSSSGSECLISDSGAPIKDSSGNVIGVVLVFRDISDEYHLQEQLRQAQKMEAVGQLAGGVAHDFNNILHVISGYVDMAMLDLEDKKNVEDSLNEIAKSSERATGLVRQLLAFSRRETLKLQNINMNDLISGLVKMIRRIIGEHIELHCHYEASINAICADPGQIEQIILNLCINSRDAMSEGGRLVIETGNVELDDDYCKIYMEAKKGKYVYLSVSDTGKGIPADIQKRIFEPFFTTKGVGEGTGLGLATVYAITKRHEGFVNLYSEIGNGTTFKIFFPVSPTTEAPPETSDKEIKIINGSGEIILFAEDDAQVRELGLKILQKGGYNVIIAKDGEEAIAKYEESKEKLKAVVLDVVMPKKNGKHVYDYIRQTDKNIPIIFSTGYTFNLLDSHFLPNEEHILVRKPFNRFELLECIYNAIKERKKM